MAKSKKIDVRAKVHFKKPLKVCEPALDDLKRIRRNEQNKLYRLGKKLQTTGKKTEADRFRKEIRAQEKTIKNLYGTVKTIQGACQNINQIKATNKSLKLSNAAIKRKLDKMYESRDFDADTYKKLQNKYVYNSNTIRANQKRATDVLYGVNKHLGFSPIETAEQLKISKKDLEKFHPEDFDEQYFDEIEEVPGGGYSGGSPGEAVEAGEFDETEESKEHDPDERGYIEQMHEIFWSVWQDFDKNERPGGLSRYKRVTFEWNGKTKYHSGNSLSEITMTAGEAWRWAGDQPPYVYAIKYTDKDFTKLKYVLYKQ